MPERKREGEIKQQRDDQRIGHRHWGLLVNLYTKYRPLDLLPVPLPAYTLNTDYTTVFCKSSTLVHLNLAVTSSFFRLHSARLLCPSLFLGLSRGRAQTSESSSTHIHPHLDRGDPFGMRNGLENTVTFSYLTHLLLFLFQPLKASTMFLFLKLQKELERSGHCSTLPAITHTFKGTDILSLYPNG